MFDPIELLDQEHITLASLRQIPALQFQTARAVNLDATRLAALTNAITHIWEARQSTFRSGGKSALPAACRRLPLSLSSGTESFGVDLQHDYPCFGSGLAFRAG
ncbi:hypothetical protein [Deinococcus sp. QL22]|uniref:hypothetical protein n=1 Tax=Deinococcus sp. QL22 TaxID=2939437 RepID=UPI0020176AFD|nr:hypothetical protein [Deinococcus sp. QL22]UQN08801.1 hypothetical protein M1R55_19535 [Deinococcus sp. QL22]